MIQTRCFPAGRRAGAAGVHASLHAADLLAIGATGIADIGAEIAKLGMELALARQEVGRGGADLRAVQHQANVLRPGMFAAHLQTVRHRHA